ncbi:MAG: NUDIX hydrolase [Bryobacterales bacterium]|nr:NUDIX hydrolase [Bryobacteraceae bacterium]MDW8129367.1 NUDIX hydrolase [Bryobacterales bacterium]
MKTLASRTLCRTKIFSVTEEHVVEPGEIEVRRAVVRHGPSAVILAVDRRERVLLVRQFRLPAGAALWELPAGRVHAGETPLAAARRELLEETGVRARRWKKLLAFYPSPGYVTERMHLYLARDLVAGEARPDEDERIRTRWFTRQELTARLRTGRIVDGKTLVGLLWWLAGGTRSSR